ncbi:MAG: DUF3082 domain-containing protein [Oscillatoriales cyanobacterium]|uniref:DUF3082 domain-containing protein n=1 Tax=Microcoleus anatoxicus PTRS2 TaxID=2705321 RepID=A0ABU8YRW8_9CYAN|nr:MAG: DUF3082 domain-containing protein [Oscillatoriales cyanobacterium]TAD92822.1 MAG: DUF3082 domain-containing protein [Oscillatoriales cyanobacterium]TAE01310.1 MAG: DUF3082 domain-containing protein [Oscillatoriales cyanobacterium]TAE98484.1 MAG: DUF3082 domain-containing protein [Oscillatoriales cyanobacterium]TAF43360.1 MAG: DUF3082 domain-containing protein [Oscillatoriales cyanobacterium]
MPDLTNSNSSSNSSAASPSSTQDALPASPQPPTVLRCLTGSLMAGGFAAALYALTLSIAQTFANKPIHSDNVTVINIAAAVRTLVMGIVALGAGVFGFAAVGLMALTLQLLIQKFVNKSTV